MPDGLIPQPTFVGEENKKSEGAQGPSAIRADIAALARMFNPNAVHTDEAGTPGGIGSNNIQEGAIAAGHISDGAVQARHLGCLTSSVGSPGSEDKVPTERGVRQAISTAGGGNVSGPDGDVVDGDMVVFYGTSGKLVGKPDAGVTGVLKRTSSGVVSAEPHVDYAPPPDSVEIILAAADWRGGSISGKNPPTDISAGTDNTFKISVSSDGAQEVVLDLTNCDTGANIAAEMQTQIQALGGNKSSVTVEYIGGRYKITSPDDGLVVITDGDTDNVADDLKLGIANGGQEGVMQVIEDDAIYGDEDTCHGDLKIAQGASRAEREAWIAGQIFVVGQDEGVIVVIADGDTPDKDIPVKIEVR